MASEKFEFQNADGETLAGRLFIKLRDLCLGHEVEALQMIGRTNFVPNAMLKHI